MLSLLTPYLQTTMNFPVFTAGLILAPRGIGTMAAMFLVGRVINRVDPRLLVLLGLGLTAFVLWQMTGYTPDVSQPTLIWNSVVQGMGLGFMFVPLSTITFATLAPEYRTQGTSLCSLPRNLGSSIGISFLSFLLERDTQTMHANLAERITPFDDAMRHGAVALHRDMATLAGRTALNAVIDRQSEIVAYNDDFRLMMIISAAAVPFLFLLRGARKGGPAAEAILH